MKIFNPWSNLICSVKLDSCVDEDIYACLMVSRDELCIEFSHGKPLQGVGKLVSAENGDETREVLMHHLVVELMLGTTSPNEQEYPTRPDLCLVPETSND